MLLNPPSGDLTGTTENERLRRVLSERIASSPLTFREFMEIVLYHPRHGYYRSRRTKLGREGDFLTSPEVHPAFGVCVARAVGAAWEGLGRPKPLVVVEPGAGSGALAADLIAALTEAGVPAIDYRIVETSPALVDLQRERLDEWADAVSWCDWETLSRPVPDAVVLSNELFDSFPVHRVRLASGHLQEAYVVEAEGRLEERWGEPSTPAIEAYFTRLGLQPGEGCVAEVNLQAPQTLRALAGSLERGVVFTFDYGYEASDLYAPWRRDGTLLCFYRHAVDTNPFVRLGRQDMTAHVDFTTLRRAGEEAGLATAGLVTQAEFLVAMGIGEYLAGSPGAAGLEEYYARRRAVTELIDTGGLGRIRALIQYRGAAVGERIRGMLTGASGAMVGERNDDRTG